MFFGGQDVEQVEMTLNQSILALIKSMLCIYKLQKINSTQFHRKIVILKVCGF